MRPLVAAIALAAAASAAPAAALADTPWAEGVPEAQQDQANGIFEEGNQLFAQQAHGPALERYRAAVALWDHPLIRFNLAVTLIRLDRPLEAADELERALRFGEAPFKKELYQQALDYQALLKGRLGTIQASCTQAGAQILLDGKPWFACPGTQSMRVMAGEHAVVGQLDGFLTKAERIVVAGGGTLTHPIELVPLDSVMVVTYRYPRWIPYSLTAAGAVIGLSGLGVYLSGRGLMDDYRDQFARECPNGCRPGDEPALDDQKARAEFRGTLGISMLVVGGAVTIGGAVMAIINRPQRSIPKVEVAPTAGGATAAATFRF